MIFHSCRAILYPRNLIHWQLYDRRCGVKHNSFMIKKETVYANQFSRFISETQCLPYVHCTTIIFPSFQCTFCCPFSKFLLLIWSIYLNSRYAAINISLHHSYSYKQNNFNKYPFNIEYIRERRNSYLSEKKSIYFIYWE